MTCRLIAYYRVSTSQQGRSGLGLEAQEAAVKAHAASTGCEIIASYTEIESGKNNHRLQLEKALAHAKGARATLVIAKLDRLSRNVAFLANLVESKVPFVACDNPHATKFTIHILAAVAEHEREMISERTKAALAAAKARGKKLGCNNLTREGSLKGAKAAGAATKAAKAEAYSYIRPIISDLRTKGLSLHKIAASLNEMGEQTRKGASWNATAVKRVLT